MAYKQELWAEAKKNAISGIKISVMTKEMGFSYLLPFFASFNHTLTSKKNFHF